FGILLYYCGILVANAQRNWFVGIRTPWTLSSDRVWEKTHRLGGRLFKAAGVLALLGIFLPGYAILFILIPAVVIAFWTIVYSYLEYRKEAKINVGAE
ncbi:MAG: SdpI family protein, partial [Dehalococcoidales bacterium]|nr:SdpI family protein [Dehalococcoidales bacterium]